LGDFGAQNKVSETGLCLGTKMMFGKSGFGGSKHYPIVFFFVKLQSEWSFRNWGF